MICRSCVDAHGELTQSAILRNPRPKYKRSKNVFAITPIALSCACICAQWLQHLAQSLIESPGVVPETLAVNIFFVILGPSSKIIRTQVETNLKISNHCGNHRSRVAWE